MALLSTRRHLRPGDGAIFIRDFEISNCRVKYFEEHSRHMLFKGSKGRPKSDIYSYTTHKSYWIPGLRELRTVCRIISSIGCIACGIPSRRICKICCTKYQLKNVFQSFHIIGRLSLNYLSCILHQTEWFIIEIFLQLKPYNI